GVERLLWTQSRLALDSARPALAVLANEGIEVMAIKGAARSVVNIAELRGRVANDIDLLVRPYLFERALQAMAFACIPIARFVSPISGAPAGRRPCHDASTTAAPSSGRAPK